MGSPLNDKECRANEAAQVVVVKASAKLILILLHRIRSRSFIFFSFFVINRIKENLNLHLKYVF